MGSLGLTYTYCTPPIHYIPCFELHIKKYKTDEAAELTPQVP